MKKSKESSTAGLLISTRKGAFVLSGDSARKNWKLSNPILLGHTVHHMMQDPRDHRTLLIAARTGHLGPTVFRSTDFGKTWKEASRPPAFPKAREGQKGQVVDHTFWLTPAHESEPNAWYAGTSPQGLFRSDDGGNNWSPVTGLNEHPEYSKWMGWVENGTPDGPKLHSVIVDPRDPLHIYVGMSSGGIHESRDGGKTWSALIDGLEVVEGFEASRVDFHDPHCMRICPSQPDRLYQQNHCGIYRIDRPSKEWIRIGKKMPKSIGDVGFGIVVHPRNADVVWVIPMDGSGVWPRTSPGGKPAVYTLRNGGKTWQRQDAGMPAENAWWTVKRQALTVDSHDPVGVYFGTTSGEVWASRDEGAKWSCIARNLPEIYGVESAQLRK
ncbi:MAG: WD40/YVTN/BNR-like repeat-containing protein [Planctomycetota bacterium]